MVTKSSLLLFSKNTQFNIFKVIIKIIKYFITIFLYLRKNLYEPMEVSKLSITEKFIKNCLNLVNYLTSEPFLTPTKLFFLFLPIITGAILFLEYLDRNGMLALNYKKKGSFVRLLKTSKYGFQSLVVLTLCMLKLSVFSGLYFSNNKDFAINIYRKVLALQIILIMTTIFFLILWMLKIIMHDYANLVLFILSSLHFSLFIVFLGCIFLLTQSYICFHIIIVLIFIAIGISILCLKSYLYKKNIVSYGRN